MTLLAITSIRRDGGTQPRASLRDDWIDEYASDMSAGSPFPPIVVFYDGRQYWLADGFHRVSAALKGGASGIDADIRQGTQRDAILFSVGANASHGHRRTNEDKRRAALTLLNDAEWAKWSDREIARKCQVTQPFVSSLRPSDNAYQIAQTRTVRRGASVYEQNTGKIGRAGTDTRCPVSDNAEVAAASYLANQRQFGLPPSVEGLRQAVKDAVVATVGAPKPRAPRADIAPDPLSRPWIEWITAVQHISKGCEEMRALAERVPASGADLLAEARLASENLENWRRELERLYESKAA